MVSVRWLWWCASSLALSLTERPGVSVANKMNKKRNKKSGVSWTTWLLTYMPFLSPMLSVSGRSATTGAGAGAGTMNKQTSLGGGGGALASMLGGGALASMGTQAVPKGASAHATARSQVANGQLNGATSQSLSLSITGYNVIAPAPSLANIPPMTAGAESMKASIRSQRPKECPPTRCTSLCWSGILLSESESQKVFRALLTAQLHTVLQELPAKFDCIVDPEIPEEEYDADIDGTEELDGFSMMAVCKGSDPDRQHDMEMLRAVELV